MIVASRSCQPLRATAAVTVVLSLGACSVFSVHKIDVRQGNALEQQAVEQLEVGMNAEQVRYLLGNPVIADSYHADRWDYVYYFKPGDGVPERRKLTVFFENGEVIRIERPRMPEGKIDG